jgi:outer membrane protein
MKQRIKTVFLMFCLGGVSFLGHAQEQKELPKEWSLRECIEYAHLHNISVLTQQNEVKTKQIDNNTAKYSRLPNLNASASQSYNWGRTVSPKDNSYSSTNSSNTNYGISTRVPVFTGFKLHNQYKLSKVNLERALVSLDKAKDDLSIQIANQYLQVLFKQELEGIARRQVDLSKQQLEKTEKMLSVGKASRADVVEAKARNAQDEMRLVEAVNNHKLALLDLAQLLQLPSPENFKLVAPERIIVDLALPTMGEVYATAVMSRPEVRAANLKIKGGEYSVKIAKANYLPTLSFEAGLSSGYYTINGESVRTFSQQFNDNLRKYIGVSLSIPIFNRFETRNAIRKAKLSQANFQLELKDEKRKLFNEIQKAWFNADAAKSKYKSAQVTVASNEEAFRVMNQKFTQGQATSLQFNEAKLNLMKAQSEALQAKYEYVFMAKILDFYNGERMK